MHATVTTDRVRRPLAERNPTHDLAMMRLAREAARLDRKIERAELALDYLRAQRERIPA